MGIVVHRYPLHYCTCSSSICSRKLDRNCSNQPRTELPAWVDNWEDTGLLSWEDKNGDGLVQYVADAEANEFKVDRDIMVLANPEIAGLPNWVVALVVVVSLRIEYSSRSFTCNLYFSITRFIEEADCTGHL